MTLLVRRRRTPSGYGDVFCVSLYVMLCIVLHTIVAVVRVAFRIYSYRSKFATQMHCHTRKVVAISSRRGLLAIGAELHRMHGIKVICQRPGDKPLLAYVYAVGWFGQSTRRNTVNYVGTYWYHGARHKPLTPQIKIYQRKSL